MGLFFRKRTKGKKGWFNFSASEGNGVSASGSFKVGKDVTVNTGSVGGKRKRKSSITINLGNGIKWKI